MRVREREDILEAIVEEREAVAVVAAVEERARGSEGEGGRVDDERSEK